MKFFTIGIVLILIFTLTGIWQHEMVHVMINEKAGVESEFRFALKDGFVPAVGIARLNAPTKEISEYDQLHIQNEIINYNLFTPLIGLMIIMVLGFAHIGEKVSKNE
jgi:hypothetical protein